MYESFFGVPGGLFGEFERLRRDFDDLFGGSARSIRSAAPGSFPAINLGHTPNSVEVYVFAPGLDASKIEVVLDRGVLTLAGERPSDLPADGKANVYTHERPSGSFRRAISLPDDVDPEQIKATYRDGVLNVSIARRESAQPRRISVQ
jgi:HSP20 family protein